MAAMNPAVPPVIPERLKTLRDAKGLSQAQLAGMVGAKQQSIDQIERGEVRRPRTLPEIARALETSTDYLTGLTDHPTAGDVKGPVEVDLPKTRIGFGGKVGAGGFLAVDEYFQQDEQPVPQGIFPDPAYAKLHQYAWLVEGDSMDEAGIPNGTWVVAADYIDFRDQVRELDNGDVVIVERSRYQDSERERTIKEVQFARSAMRLVPRSSNPRHREIVIPLDREAEDDVEVRVLAVVLLGVQTFSRR